MKTTPSTAQLADELADHIWLNALSNREVRSVADSINYRVGFPAFGKKAWLRSQLCCLCVFIGTLALRETLQDSCGMTGSEVERIIAQYTERLFGRCVPQQIQPKYRQRLHVWSELFDGAEPSEAFIELGASFYEFLTGQKADPEDATILGLRFMRYVPLFTGSIENMRQDLELVRT